MDYQLYPGDCLDVMKGLEAGSVDAIITGHLDNRATLATCGTYGKGRQG